MSVTYAIRFKVRDGARPAFDRLLGEVLEAMRHETTFVDAALHVSPDEPCDLLLVETWESHRDVVEVQLNRAYRRAWHAALPELLEAPREVSVWTRLREDRKKPRVG